MSWFSATTVETVIYFKKKIRIWHDTKTMKTDKAHAKRDKLISYKALHSQVRQYLGALAYTQHKASRNSNINELKNESLNFQNLEVIVYRHFRVDV